ncbi:hypothetical protein BDB01DRAFT_95869 [Pilobolus umbonatus]|nr:hypothetical protein BDB01DRAFT_95869 [Pilobolus umbonatus]
MVPNIIISLSLSNKTYSILLIRIMSKLIQSTFIFVLCCYLVIVFGSGVHADTYDLLTASVNQLSASHTAKDIAYSVATSINDEIKSPFVIHQAQVARVDVGDDTILDRNDLSDPFQAIVKDNEGQGNDQKMTIGQTIGIALGGVASVAAVAIGIFVVGTRRVLANERLKKEQWDLEIAEYERYKKKHPIETYLPMVDLGPPFTFNYDAVYNTIILSGILECRHKRRQLEQDNVEVSSNSESWNLSNNEVNKITEVFDMPADNENMIDIPQSYSLATIHQSLSRRSSISVGSAVSMLTKDADSSSDEMDLMDSDEEGGLCDEIKQMVIDLIRTDHERYIENRDHVSLQIDEEIHLSAANNNNKGSSQSMMHGQDLRNSFDIDGDELQDIDLGEHLEGTGNSSSNVLTSYTSTKQNNDLPTNLFKLLGVSKRSLLIGDQLSKRHTQN